MFSCEFCEILNKTSFTETSRQLLQFITSRSSNQKCSMKNGVLRNFTKFTGKLLCQNLFFNKVAGLRPATLFKKRLWHRYFPVNFVKFLRTPFLKNTSRRLLLNVHSRLKVTIFQILKLKRPNMKLVIFTKFVLVKKCAYCRRFSCTVIPR